MYTRGDALSLLADGLVYWDHSLVYWDRSVVYWDCSVALSLGSYLLFDGLVYWDLTCLTWVFTVVPLLNGWLLGASPAGGSEDSNGGWHMHFQGINPFHALLQGDHSLPDIGSGLVLLRLSCLPIEVFCFCFIFILSSPCSYVCWSSVGILAEYLTWFRVRFCYYCFVHLFKHHSP